MKGDSLMYGTFLECHLDDCELELLDGTIWSINPGDLSIVSCWTPSTKVKIETISSNRYYNYKITNLTDNSFSYASKI